MKEQFLIDIIIIDTQKDFTSLLKSALENIERIREIYVTDNLQYAFNTLENYKYFGILIDIYSIGVKDSLEFIENVRQKFPIIPICLLGTTKQLLEYPNLDTKWKERFDHYFKLFKDQPASLLNSQIENTIYKFETYLVSRLAKVKLSDLRNILSHRYTYSLNDSLKEKVEEIIDVTENALDRKSSKEYNVVPGFENEDVQELVKETISKTNKILDRTASINYFVLTAGILLTVASFIVAVINNSWEAVTFGGFGIAGIITSLIKNPLRTISNASTKVVQLQVAYLSFLNQVHLLNNDLSNSENNNSLKRSESLRTATNDILKILNGS